MSRGPDRTDTDNLVSSAAQLAQGLEQDQQWFRGVASAPAADPSMATVQGLHSRPPGRKRQQPDVADLQGGISQVNISPRPAVPSPVVLQPIKRRKKQHYGQSPFKRPAPPAGPEEQPAPKRACVPPMPDSSAVKHRTDHAQAAPGASVSTGGPQREQKPPAAFGSMPKHKPGPAEVASEDSDVSIGASDVKAAGLAAARSQPAAAATQPVATGGAGPAAGSARQPIVISSSDDEADHVTTWRGQAQQQQQPPQAPAAPPMTSMHGRVNAPPGQQAASAAAAAAPQAPAHRSAQQHVPKLSPRTAQLSEEILQQVRGPQPASPVQPRVLPTRASRPATSDASRRAPVAPSWLDQARAETAARQHQQAEAAAGAGSAPMPPPQPTTAQQQGSHSSAPGVDPVPQQQQQMRSDFSSIPVHLRPQPAAASAGVPNGPSHHEAKAAPSGFAAAATNAFAATAAAAAHAASAFPSQSTAGSAARPTFKPVHSPRTKAAMQAARSKAPGQQAGERAQQQQQPAPRHHAAQPAVSGGKRPAGAAESDAAAARPSKVQRTQVSEDSREASPMDIDPPQAPPPPPTTATAPRHTVRPQGAAPHRLGTPGSRPQPSAAHPSRSDIPQTWQQKAREVVQRQHQQQQQQAGPDSQAAGSHRASSATPSATANHRPAANPYITKTERSNVHRRFQPTAKKPAAASGKTNNISIHKQDWTGVKDILGDKPGTSQPSRPPVPSHLHPQSQPQQQQQQRAQQQQMPPAPRQAPPPTRMHPKASRPQQPAATAGTARRQQQPQQQQKAAPQRQAAAKPQQHPQQRPSTRDVLSDDEVQVVGQVPAPAQPGQSTRPAQPGPRSAAAARSSQPAAQPSQPAAQPPQPTPSSEPAAPAAAVGGAGSEQGKGAAWEAAQKAEWAARDAEVARQAHEAQELKRQRRQAAALEQRAQARLEDHRRTVAVQAMALSQKDALLGRVRQQLQTKLRFAYSPQMVLRYLNIPLRGQAPPTGIAPSAQLKSTFKVAMAQWHPDRHSAAGPEEQAYAEEMFKVLNQWSQKVT